MKEVTSSNVSAFAVYKNLVPGVKSYEDHNTSTSKKTKTRKKVVSNGQSSVADKGKTMEKKPPIQSSPSSSNVNGSVVNGKKKSRKRRRGAKKNPVGTENTAAATVQGLQQTKKTEVLTKPPSKKVKLSKTMTPAQVEQQLKSTWKTVKPAEVEEFKLKPKPTLKKVQPAKIEKQSQVSKKSKTGAKTKVLTSTHKWSIIRSVINSKGVEDGKMTGRIVFEWLIFPMSFTTFFTEHWEKKPVHVRHGPNYFKWLLSSQVLDQVLRDNKLWFGRNVDLTSYNNGVRETHNPEGRVMPSVVWDYYNNGCSVRFLNPQTYVQNLWRLNTSLQELFGTFVGANVYLTPADTQGFAPHYDDIEAFVLQVEGKKHWKLYGPRSKAEELPRVSSGNFNEKTDNIGKPILDVILEEGDVLYFPRGTIHQAKAVADEHSLHITVSCYQANTYADLLKHYLPMALEKAAASSVKFRQGLPMDYLSYMGMANANTADKAMIKKRAAFQAVVTGLVEEVTSSTCDFAADQLGKKLVWDSLPPFLTIKEKERSVYEDGEFMTDGRVMNSCEISPDVQIKIARSNCLRLVAEDNVFKVFYTQDNSLEYHGEEAQFVEVPEELVPAVQYLISKYPEYTTIQNLPVANDMLKLQMASDFWEKGLLLTKLPLTATDVENMEVENESSEGEMDDNDSDINISSEHEDSLESDTDSDQ